MMAREVSQRTYPEIGVTEPHHSISHHGNRPEAIAGHAKLNAYHVGMFAKFVERLRSTPDGDGSLLDHSLLVYGSGMSDGNGHTGSPLPHVLVGGASGRINGNRHIVTPESTPDGEPAAGNRAEVRSRAGEVWSEQGRRRDLSPDSTMFIHKAALPRRRILKGMGAALALPLLDAMLPALTPTVKTGVGPT
jgi:hypothetical protein